MQLCHSTHINEWQTIPQQHQIRQFVEVAAVPAPQLPVFNKHDLIQTEIVTSGGQNRWMSSPFVGNICGSFVACVAHPRRNT